MANIDIPTVIWVLLCAALVYFMQAGFALCEAGLTRAKNTGNILMKNMMDFCIGTPCFWLIGFGLMFNGTGAFIGKLDPMILGRYTAENSVVPQIHGGKQCGSAEYASMGICDFSDSFLRHGGYHCFRFHGGADKF